MPLDWCDATASPRAAPWPDEGLLSLGARCGERDLALDAVALRLAQRQQSGLPAPDIEQIAQSLRASGAPYVWPRAWSLGGGVVEASSAEPHLESWLESFNDGGVRRCGMVAIGEGSQQVVAAVAVDAMADLQRPLPIRVDTGRWLDFEARLLTSAAAAKLMVLAPRGRPFAVPTSLRGDRVRARFRADRPGRWLVQLLASVETGPRPVLEAVIWVDRDPSDEARDEPAPGEAAADAARSLRDQLAAMVNGARQSERLDPLASLPQLDELALAHAEAMQRAQQIGHDVGDGDPKSRVLGHVPGALAVGENVAHAASPVRAHRSLWSSPSHRGNLLGERFTHLGIGVAADPEGTVWVTELFAQLPSRR